jgi:peptidoglycan/xylan/chitin deacetylase (PgdA/CDA1 family)
MRTIQANAAIFDLWAEEFRAIHRRRGLFVLTMHPQISGRPSRVDRLAALIAEMRQHAGVWFATGEQVATHLRDRLSAQGAGVV